MHLDTHIYDLIIIGAGPAGMSAGIYAGRAMLDTLIIEKGRVGGQVTTTNEIVNYPGIKKVTGAELMQDMYEQAEGFGVQIKLADIKSVDFAGRVKLLHTDDRTYQARAVIITTGAQARKIGFPGESEFTGRGVAYCSTCDGEFFKDVPVFVVGGGFAAAEEAVFLTRFASEVTVVMRGDDFTCARATADLAKRHPKVKIWCNTEIKEVSGKEALSRAVFTNKLTGEETVFEAPRFGVFVLAGTVPQSELFSGVIDTAPDGYIAVNEHMETNIPGVYAAGDILPKELRQIVTAVSDGAVAATGAQEYIARLRAEEGLPEISEAVLERHQQLLAREKAAGTETKDTASVRSGRWFNEKMAGQLKNIFAKLTGDAEISLFLDPSHEKSADMYSFMAELAELSPRISVKKYAPDSAKAKGFNVTRMPAAVIVTDEHSGGIRFSGIPSGHEVNSLVLALYNTAGPGQEISQVIKDRINKLAPVKLEICVSLTCHFCPDVVAACQRIASLNRGVQAEMIDAALYPELKDKYNLMSFPTLIINDGEKILYGAQTLEQIVEALESM